MKENKLWVLPTTEEALEEVEKRPHSYGNADHCLYIGPEGPEGSREVCGDLVDYLTPADWRWIYSESDKIRTEREAIYRAKVEEEREAFLKRFDAEMEKELTGGNSGEPETGETGRNAETE